VVARVAVTNRLDSPVTIDGSEMFGLYLEGKTFSPDFDAMNSGTDDGLIYEEIQPDQTVTGDVVFAVAPKRVDGLDKDGNFVVLQFSDVDSFGEAKKRIGFIRTYN
jgi:hypothetical protein